MLWIWLKPLLLLLKIILLNVIQSEAKDLNTPSQEYIIIVTKESALGTILQR